MEIVLYYTQRKRPLISIPWSIAKFQGKILGNLPLPPSLSINSDQIEQLKLNNVVTPLHELNKKENYLSFRGVLSKYANRHDLTSVHDVLPYYLPPDINKDEGFEIFSQHFLQHNTNNNNDDATKRKKRDYVKRFQNQDPLDR